MTLTRCPPSQNASACRLSIRSPTLPDRPTYSPIRRRSKGFLWPFRVRKQNANTNADAVASKPQDTNLSHKRQNYFRRLGINKDRNTPWRNIDDFVEETESSTESNSDETAESTNKEAELNVVDIKNLNNFRVNFLRKLSYEKVWIPKAQQSPKSQTVLIFDWDDTLLCTNFLYSNGNRALSDVIHECVQMIGNTVRTLLELATQLGNTFIITNAEEGWVEYSCKRWIPDLFPVLQKIHIISARSKYEPQFPGEVNKWKLQTFLEVQKKLDQQPITNLVSLGDSHFEMEAVYAMGKQFAQACIKTVKFLPKPSPKELLNELQLLTQGFERIVGKAHNWDGGAVNR